MTTAKTLLFLGLIAACDKKSTTEPAKTDPPKPVATTVEKAAAPDAACAAKVKDLEPWLAALELERKSYEIDFGYKLQPIDRTPMPVPQHVDVAMITKSAIQAYDISESNHVGGKPGEHAAQKEVVDQLAKMRAMAAGKEDAFEAAPDDLLRIDVDQQATWGDVARVVDAATKAGYAKAVFAFTATPQLAQPPGVDAQTMSEAAQKEASAKIEALQKACKPWDSVALRHKPARSPSEDALATAKETAAAIAECNCAANPDDIRAAMWKDARWHQAVPRVGITIALAGEAKPLALPAKTPWSEAAGKLVEAAPDGASVKLVAK